MEKEIQKAVRIGYAGVIFTTAAAVAFLAYLAYLKDKEWWYWPLAFLVVFSITRQSLNTLKRISFGKAILREPEQFSAEQKREYLDFSNNRTEADLVGGSRRTLWILIVVLTGMLLFFALHFFEII